MQSTPTLPNVYLSLMPCLQTRMRFLVRPTLLTLA